MLNFMVNNYVKLTLSFDIEKNLRELFNDCSISKEHQVQGIPSNFKILQINHNCYLKVF